MIKMTSIQEVKRKRITPEDKNFKHQAMLEPDLAKEDHPEDYNEIHKPRAN